MKMKLKKLIVQMKKWIWKVAMEMIENLNIGKYFRENIIEKEKHLFFCLISYSDDDEDITSEEEADVRLPGILKACVFIKI
jgi:hypothetical protein